MTHDYWLALFGGALAGTATSMMWLGLGRITGVSGISGGLIDAPAGDRAWRVLFVVGLIVGGFIISVFAPNVIGRTSASFPLVVAAGLFVGFGTTIGSGCTSGHGVCGVSRFSLRSIVATLAFIGAGVVTVYVMRLIAGASP